MAKSAILLIVGVIGWVFSVRQLYSAIAYGLVYSGPRSSVRWLSFDESPYYFVLALVIYLAGFCFLTHVGFFTLRDAARRQ
ncbi:hypothetical protein BHK69_12815 [Bosea vaviloviae]|uniref:Uncharacterized protein n=1 Tax=Bosea vaviloviae TaxID=1526658 RepID=A0A1D7U1H4_9HYPH|nr:hypothetical protein BHK69_12815 [Bosea vaviloviae]